jgi:CDP-diacylglycerol--serine O-phosphatidyltransferase
MEGTPKIDKKNFIGLPIPAAAGLIASIVHFAPQPIVLRGANLADLYNILLMILIGGLGLLMVSTLRYTSFKSAGAGKRSGYLILVIAAVGMLVWLYSRYVLLALGITYVSHGIIWHFLGLLPPQNRVQKVIEEKIQS